MGSKVQIPYVERDENFHPFPKLRYTKGHIHASSWAATVQKVMTANGAMSFWFMRK
jgi:hypothetical protein